MQRRDFFKIGGVLGAASVLPSVAFAAANESKSSAVRTFDVRLSHLLKEKGKNARFWLPLVTSTDFQQLVSDYKITTNAKEYYISDLAIPTLFADFKEGQVDPAIDVEFKVRTTERNTDFSKVNFNENEKLSKEIEFYLKATAQIPTTGIVKEFADKIIGKTKGDLEKARLIYNWVANTMERDNSVPGCGRGDVKAILESGKLVGKCTDINSVFVGLCRAVGIPARELFGIRVGASRFSGQMGAAPKEDGLSHISGGQHCRAEFYLKGYGWVPVDPADVTKVRLGEKLSNSDTKLAQIRDYLFGNWEMCWIGFNYGRDFDLKPLAEQRPINNFGYPYAEVDGNTLDYYNPKEFSYDYVSKEI
ncbi:transglutaminase domain-containing protein [Campylobacter sp. RM9344]|uniref:Transglutaminase domain-containing protein n=1 Tax=Campylobacter californiensis TaxID=1032243 RepID=A0AAW3ZTK6_9BACT|nr:MULTISPECIES: transglutaminase domain-containing protein [unclassified Campylobacter]MBE2985393.1 transglutaminase domain-containing protein [Campylobacter sp. RM6883]MBE2987158.1 transglutaminase domain-containing protein [Campylobacter sp. RM12919]MBE2987653.1 transglutaminase domain-containing protein [Campylobacter sp. RM12920]MBE2995973.1 transglutaminase domain-containing protein [Campylobacter sp. RM6913]MBE3022296.1 transglutaminase domain-containing protein [Campylobacter sp. 7477a